MKHFRLPLILRSPGRLLWSSALTLLSLLAFSQPAGAETEEEFQAWLQGFKPRARQAGISATTIEQAFAGVRLNPRIIELDRRQPEFTRTFWQYFELTVTDQRIQRGGELLGRHRPLLEQVTRRYGIPGRFLVAFWGMETNFGDHTGTIPIIEALATLSFDPRRRDFFSKQLIYALRILDEGHVPLEQLKGSWAGAMGQPQFMPYNYVYYTVDGDGSGRKDLWNSLPDVFHSSGNFLENLGWRRGETWGREVLLPDGFDYALADGVTLRPMREWRNLGLTLAGGRALPETEMSAALLLAGDYRGPAFLVYHNFFVIKRWNNSNNYALAVGHLADRMIGAPRLSKTRPADDEALSRENVMEIQELLNLLGYSVGSPDGMAGSRTRSGLRQFQAKRHLPADGFASMRMLNLLRAAQAGEIPVIRGNPPLK
jgi:membrane-bound lytic murein transglycosylase B